MLLHGHPHEAYSARSADGEHNLSQHKQLGLVGWRIDAWAPRPGLNVQHILVSDRALVTFSPDAASFFTHGFERSNGHVSVEGESRFVTHNEPHGRLVPDFLIQPWGSSGLSSARLTSGEPTSADGRWALMRVSTMDQFALAQWAASASAHSSRRSRRRSPGPPRWMYAAALPLRASVKARWQSHAPGARTVGLFLAPARLRGECALSGSTARCPRRRYR